MLAIEIVSIAHSNGVGSYRASAGDKSSIGSTLGQALDALTLQLEQNELKGVLLLKSQADTFFTVQQQERLAVLMETWRSARDEGKSLLPEVQNELGHLVELELKAATHRSAMLLEQVNNL